MVKSDCQESGHHRRLSATPRSLHSQDRLSHHSVSGCGVLSLPCVTTERVVGPPQPSPALCCLLEVSTSHQLSLRICTVPKALVNNMLVSRPCVSLRTTEVTDCNRSIYFIASRVNRQKRRSLNILHYLTLGHGDKMNMLTFLR